MIPFLPLGTDQWRQAPIDYVTWPELLEWAKAHGAINDRIQKIELSTTKDANGDMRGVVTMIGFAENADGKPYVVGNDLARWQVTNEVLRWLPQ